MKRLFLALILIQIFISTGCHKRYSEMVYSADLREYSRDNFFITSLTSVDFDYEPVATIQFECIPGEDRSLHQQEEWNDYDRQRTDYHYRNRKYKLQRRFYFQPSDDYLLMKMTEKAKEMGADAIINFQVVRHHPNGRHFARKTKAFGYAVKRK